jgi:tetratricopeptide (TPR) repeat protein
LLRQLRDAYQQAARRDSNARYYAIAGLLAVRGDDLEAAVDLYEQATEHEPNNLEHRRNYTLVLSDTQSYDQALAQAQTGLEMAQNREDAQQELSDFRYLVNVLQPKVAGGE